MQPPVLITLGYLVVNFALMVWIVREETAGRVPPASLVVTGRGLRYGPPLLGFGYLVTIAGDWPFFLFVLGFFAMAFGLLNGLLSTPIRPKK
ncbi:MAG TPA: hypothetical protein VHR55_12590 [Candidatus Limnocylindria bacterium]|nr:hypothetical protein [Candidatus Limnocylindria bacterium]